MTYKDLLDRVKMNDKDILNVYQYGSHVYGTNRKTSDFDFQIIVANKERDEFSDNLINIFFYTPTEFEAKLKNHDIMALECYFAPEHCIWKELLKFNFDLDLSKLRSSLSAKADNSFVKAKKKFLVEKDYDPLIGKKSLFHSLRILRFGIQIAEKNQIYNFQECNELFTEIMDTYHDWPSLFNQYKKQYNELKSLFRLVAPK